MSLNKKLYLTPKEIVELLEKGYANRPIVVYLRMCLSDREFDVFPKNTITREHYQANVLLLLTVMTQYVHNRAVPESSTLTRMVRSIGEW